MVDAVRIAEKALGEVHFGLSGKRRGERALSPLVVCGGRCEAGRGIHGRMCVPFGRQRAAHAHLKDVLGRSAARASSGTPLSWDFVSDHEVLIVSPILKRVAHTLNHPSYRADFRRSEARDFGKPWPAGTSTHPNIVIYWHPTLTLRIGTTMYFPIQSNGEK